MSNFPETIRLWWTGIGLEQAWDKDENAPLYIRADTIPTWQDISTYDKSKYEWVVFTGCGGGNKHDKDVQFTSTGQWNGDMFTNGYVAFVSKPTHWMPLPTAPNK